MEVVEWPKAIATTEQSIRIYTMFKLGRKEFNHELQVWHFNGCLAAAIPNGGIWFAQVINPIYGHSEKKKKKKRYIL